MDTQNASPQSWSQKPYWKGKFNIWNTLWLLTSPIIALVGCGVYLYYWGFSWANLALFLGLHALTGLGITAGYHRYYSHRAYECSRWVQLLYLLFGAAAFENSVLVWASNHRFHHRYVDEEGDPYNIQKGFFWAHMGWIFFKDPKERTFDNVPYLLNDRLVMWQHRNYLLIASLMSFGLPTLIGALYGSPMGGFFWGGWLRMVVVHHGTFLINSASHKIGSRPHSTENSARNCWWLAFFTFGEGYHNFHHAFASDYRNGFRWYHWDPTKWVIYGLSRVGAAWNLSRTPKRNLRGLTRAGAHEAELHQKSSVG